MPEISQGHPWGRNVGAVWARGKRIAGKRIAARHTWSGLGGDYEVREVDPQDGNGYLVMAVITTGVTQVGEFVQPFAITDKAHFGTAKECESWARAWVRTKPASPAAP